MSELVIYTLSQCSTCRDAVRWLKSHGIAYHEKPIRETPPGLPELRRALAAADGHVRRLFNTSGMEYRALGLAEVLPRLTDADALRLLASNGRLVKRPLAIGSGVALVGFNPEHWASVLPSS